MKNQVLSLLLQQKQHRLYPYLFKNSNILFQIRTVVTNGYCQSVNPFSKINLAVNLDFMNELINSRYLPKKFYFLQRRTKHESEENNLMFIN